MKTRRIAAGLLAGLLLVLLFAGCGEKTPEEPDSASESESESPVQEPVPPCPRKVADGAVEKYYPGAETRSGDFSEAGEDGRASFTYLRTVRADPVEFRREIVTAYCVYDRGTGEWQFDRAYADITGYEREKTESCTFGRFSMKVPASWKIEAYRPDNPGEALVIWTLEGEEVLRFSYGQDFEDPENAKPLNFEGNPFLSDLFFYQSKGNHIRVVLRTDYFRLGSQYPAFETDALHEGQLIGLLGTLGLSEFSPGEDPTSREYAIGDTVEASKARFTLDKAELVRAVSLEEGDGYLLPVDPDADGRKIAAGEGETLLAVTFTAESIDPFKTWFIGERSGWRIQWEVSAGDEAWVYDVLGQEKDDIYFRMERALFSEDGGATWQEAADASVELFSEKTVTVRTYGVIKADLLSGDPGEMRLTVNVLDGENAYLDYTYLLG